MRIKKGIYQYYNQKIYQDNAWLHSRASAEKVLGVPTEKKTKNKQKIPKNSTMPLSIIGNLYHV